MFPYTMSKIIQKKLWVASQKAIPLIFFKFYPSNNFVAPDNRIPYFNPYPNERVLLTTGAFFGGGY